MIQLRRIRTYTPLGQTKPKTYQTWFSPDTEDILATSVLDLFKNIDLYINKIPPGERYNVHFTQSHTTGGKKLPDFSKQEIVVFDIDYADTSRWTEYVEAFFEAVPVDRAKTAQVASGHGFHFIVALAQPIETLSWFKENKRAYNILCERVEKGLKSRGLPGSLDRQIFTGRTLRLPLTTNRKEGMPDVPTYFIESKIEPQKFDLKKAAGVQDLKADEFVPEAELKYFKIDTPAVLDECRFLRHCKEAPESLNEPEWYASLGILGHLEEGDKIAHQFSEGHPGYDPDETDRKLQQALAASGPRTCQSINNIWNNCESCPHFHKINSPVSIRGPKFIATEASGFYIKKGKKLDPQYEDLRRYLEGKHPYIVNQASEVVYAFARTHFKVWKPNDFKAFAHQNMNPLPAAAHTREFVEWVARTNRVQDRWFQESISNHINFQNGVLDIETGKLKDHEPGFGFLYCLPFDYDPEAKCPTFDQFMKNVTGSDRQVEELLLEYIGYSLCDRTYRHQKGVLLVGEGSNGKSTLTQIVGMLAGKENVSYFSLDELQKDTNRSALEGKLLNISEELPNYSLRVTDLFKKLMGGEVTARRLYYDTSSLQNTAKFLFACNKLPYTGDTSHGLLRRLIIVRFKTTFKVGVDADLNILDKIKGELPGVFNRCFEGFKRLEKNGTFTEAQAVNNELESYKQKIDPVGSWILEHLEWGPGTETSLVECVDLYNKFSAAWEAMGEQRMRQRDFNDHLERLIPDYKTRHDRRTIAGKKKTVIAGVRYVGTAPESH